MEPDRAPDDHELARQAVAGDQAALSTLYGRHRHRLKEYIRARLGHRLRAKVDSDDILQSALLAALRHDLTALGDDVRFAAAMKTVIERTIRDHARYFSREKRLTGREAPGRGLSSMADPRQTRTPSDSVKHEEDALRVRKAMEKLSETDRHLVRLARLEGRSTADVARILGKSAETTRRAIHRALARLGQILAD